MDHLPDNDKIHIYLNIEMVYGMSQNTTNGEITRQNLSIQIIMEQI